MLKVIKQSLVSYTVENNTLRVPVVGRIDKVDCGYTVSLKDTLMGCFNKHDFVFGSFKEAKEHALQWAEGGTYDQNN